MATRPYSDHPEDTMPSRPYSDNPDRQQQQQQHTIDDMEDVEDPVEHSLPTPEGQRVTAALDGQSGDGRPLWISALDTKRKRLLIIGSVGVVVCLVLIIALSFSLSDRGDGGGGDASGANAIPKASPSAFAAVVEYLSGFGGKMADRDQLLKEGTPQNLAANWMAVDAYVAIPTTDHVDEAFPFVQRYALAVWYYALNGDKWTHKYSFLSRESECDKWQEACASEKDDKSHLICGVQCDGRGRVSNILMPSNGLAGSLPSEIHLIPSLTRLSLYNNTITGELPSGMQHLTALDFLSLEENFFFGSVPTWLGRLTKLQYLNFGSNGFEGRFPSEMSSMTKLKEASFEENMMTGNIHGAFNGIATLKALFLGKNAFHEILYGDFLKDASGLAHLDLSDNQFSGSLPTHIVNLLLLDIRNNSFTGPFPDISGDGDKLQYLAINNNKFSGTIQSYIAQLTDLYHLDMSNNQFSGDIPSEIGTMTNLQYLFLSENTKLTTGNIPDLSRLTDLKALHLRHTNRDGSFPDFIGEKLTNLIVLDLSVNPLSNSLPTNLETLTSLGYMAAFGTDLVGNATEICTYGKISYIMLDCSFDTVSECPCCKYGCCDDSNNNNNCTDMSTKDLSNYLKVGYPKEQTLFQEDILPQ